MNTIISPSTTPWLQANQEFMEWMRDCGVDPNDCKQIEMSEDFSRMTVTLYKKDLSGKRYVDLATGNAAVKTREVNVKVPFPMRFLDPSTAR
jgi:hypothetical protein